MPDILLTILGVFIIIVLWVVLYDSNRFVVREHTITDGNIKKPCRAVVLSDLHNKSYGRDNSRLLEAIRELQPDFILIAGDMITSKPGMKQTIATNFMEALAGEYPIYYGNGNHEHRVKLYPEKYKDMGVRYQKMLDGCGVNTLVNSHITLAGTGITVYGAEIDRFYYKRFKVQHMEDTYMQKLLGSPKESAYNILLAHNPDYFPQYAAWGADLVLSGHVHGGMVRVPLLGRGVVSPNVRLFPEYDGGVYTRDKSVMLLSRGLGMHTIPIRFNNPGEVLMVEFKPKE